MNENLCMGCMENKGDVEVCPFCGYSENSPRIQSCLPPRSLISGRYLVGKVLSYNGEGVTYIGFDTVSDRKVTVREFFPDGLVSRGEDSRTIEVKPNYQIQYKTYLSDFLEVNEKIAHLRSISSLTQILDIAEDCGTVYSISEYPIGETLEQFLQRRGMMLTWGETYELLLPVIRTMQLVHEDGIIHRGISPSTIYITSSGRAKLSGFCISAVRAARTDLAAELFPGFSAPEQYSTTSPHGTWTDIYAICAVMYLCVTGIAPPEALIRTSENEIIRPRERNETVPVKVSNAIIQGLALRPDDRIRTIPELTSKLLPARTNPADMPTVAIPVSPNAGTPKYPSGNGTRPPQRHNPAQQNPHTGNRPASAGSPNAPRNTSRPNPQRSSQQRPQQTKVNPRVEQENQKKKEKSLVMKAMLITLPILLVILILTFWILFGNSSNNKTESYKNNIVASESEDSNSEESSGFGNYTKPVTSEIESSSSSSSSEPVSSSEASSEPSSEESSEENNWSMVQLVGRQLEDVQNDGEVTGHITIDSNIEYVYSESSSQGEIIWQDTSVGTTVENGSTVHIKVSKGSQYVTIPDWDKKSKEEYCAMLDELSIPYDIIIQVSTDYPSGYVTGCDRMVGSKYDLESGTSISVYVCENDQSY